MALRTADFFEEGRKDAAASRARGALVALRYERGHKSWQARAYWEGFDAEIERLSKSAVLSAPQKAVKQFLVMMGSATKHRVKGRSRRGWTAPKP